MIKQKGDFKLREYKYDGDSEDEKYLPEFDIVS